MNKIITYKQAAKLMASGDAVVRRTSLAGTSLPDATAWPVDHATWNTVRQNGQLFVVLDNVANHTTMHVPIDDAELPEDIEQREMDTEL